MLDTPSSGQDLRFESLKVAVFQLPLNFKRRVTHTYATHARHVHERTAFKDRNHAIYANNQDESKLPSKYDLVLLQISENPASRREIYQLPVC